jgi:hypothetical protein
MYADEGGPEEAIARAIVNHLGANPLAADSVDGVARWWLGEMHSIVTLKEVERALELLVTRDVMRRLKLGDGTYLYSKAHPARH